MQSPLAWVLVGIAIVCGVISNIVFRYAAHESGFDSAKLFGLGIAIGFWVPVCITLALARGNANIVFALVAGVTCGGLQLATWYLFREPLAWWQVTGIVLICLGTILASWKGTSPESEIDASGLPRSPAASSPDESNLSTDHLSSGAMPILDRSG